MNKLFRAFVLALSLVVMPASLLSMAQTGGSTTADPYGTTTAQNARTDDGNDWGWLGLLGLVGLAGLVRRREEPGRHRANDPVTSR